MTAGGQKTDRKEAAGERNANTKNFATDGCVAVDKMRVVDSFVRTSGFVVEST